GPMAWTVEDCAILLQAIVGHDAADPASTTCASVDFRAALRPDLRGLRVGVLRHFWEEDAKANDEMSAAMNAALDVLAQLGARAEAARMRPLLDSRDVKNVMGECEIFSIYSRDIVGRPGVFGADFLGRSPPACLFDGTDYVQAHRMRRR